MRTDRRIYLSQDRSRVVEESDPDAGWLLAPAGGTIDDAEARRLGLLPRPKAVPAAEDKAVPAPPQSKPIMPRQNKRARGR